MKKRLWSILLTACLLVGLLPTVALAAGNAPQLRKTWAREGDGPLSDGGRIGDVPMMLALSLRPASSPHAGRRK